ncbi:hypothetical protein [Streptomyces sp. WMMC1477]|uniref:hypothetical protein n=1 Tax=Streptomyces sp. WMMC1477 TaxID=3015155 RepID=UPI0022B685A0|nr:hypothetical protein [Streptomyces sp. WMMC1477]MCZ7433317.1 hypothetical protein [Streptomyces sp. WMMC1477]
MDAAEAVEKIVRTCLYEGYLLWPYRRSALKNTKRWTFGGVFPAGVADALGEPATQRTQVLLYPGPAEPAELRPRLTVRVPFLHVVDRAVLREGPAGPEPVDAVTVAGERYVAWQEATEREVSATLDLDELRDGPRLLPLDIPAGTEHEPLYAEDGTHAATLVRGWQALTGTVALRAEALDGGVHRVEVRVENTTRCPAPQPGDRAAREKAAAHALISTHTVLHCEGARFVSLLDPPPHLAEAAAGCRNEGVWPVLVDGGPGGLGAGRAERTAGAHTVLASPVTLYDFPAVAPESPGDLFDGTEIDQLLVRCVLSLTEEEQAEARAADPRAREILDRCSRLSPAELAALHGTIREFRPLEQT